MKTFFPMLLLLTLAACESTPSGPAAVTSVLTNSVVVQDSVVYSFAYVGCNRVDQFSSDNPSTINKPIFDMICADVMQRPHRPNLFFFLGDLVLGEKDTRMLDTELQAWVSYYKKSAIAKAGIEMVAVPGNHEMLHHHNPERPLKGATEVWLKYMSPFMPAKRDTVQGDSAYLNKMTFAFKRGSYGFIVMNTDTYNEDPGGSDGTEGKIAQDWVFSKIAEYSADTSRKVFVFSHKPAYASGSFQFGHSGFPMSATFFQTLTHHKGVALLSAHVHNYQRAQPGGSGPYQIVAGNGGSPPDGSYVSRFFYGYSIINIYKSGKIVQIARGQNQASDTAMITMDSTVLSWQPNANPYR